MSTTQRDRLATESAEERADKLQHQSSFAIAESACRSTVASKSPPIEATELRGRNVDEKNNKNN